MDVVVGGKVEGKVEGGQLCVLLVGWVDGGDDGGEWWEEGSGKSAVATTRRLATGTAVQTCRPVHGSGSPFMTFGESCTCADAIARTRTCAMAVLRKVCTRSTVRILPIGRIGAVLQTHRQRHDLAYQNAAHGRERSPPTTRRLFRVRNFFITTAMRRLCA